MKKIKVCIIGAGNISNTRHIPALKKLRKEVEIIGVLSSTREKAENTAKKHRIANFAEVNNPENDKKWLVDLDWFGDVDAVVIGVPPKQHYDLVKMSLELDKHVLIEKPMMMDKKECDDCVKLAKRRKLILYVMHNFQFASKMQRLNKIIKNKEYGRILSITEVQFSNLNRRLPKWYNDLPLGLFYDEAAHFAYLPALHAGPVRVVNSFATWNKNKNVNTPNVLTVNALAGEEVPLTMLIDVTSPICEWYYVVNFKDRICKYDLFKDILIDLPSDNEHTVKEVFSNSVRSCWQYWVQFIANGFKMFFGGGLFYGHDVEMKKFINAAKTGKVDRNISAEAGRETVILMNDIVEKTEREKS